MNMDFLIFKKKIFNKLQNFLSFIDSDKIIYDFIKKNLSDVNEKYKNFVSPEDSNNSQKTIWLFWWQGYDSAPLLVKKCIDSVKKNANGKEVVILTEQNYSQYTNIPDYIIEKLNQKKITLTHFSDILRMELLSSKGGLWLDATIFVSRQIPVEYFEMPYFTINYPTSKSRIAMGKWCGFCQAAQTNRIIHRYCRDVFYSYWEKFDKLIDYFLIDYAMRYGYDNFSNFRSLVDSVPENNIGIKDLDLHFNDEYSETEYNNILDSSVFFKLNWKRNYKEQTEDGKLSNYGFFMNN